MKYKYLDGYRIADSIADLKAIYPLLQTVRKESLEGFTDSAHSEMMSSRRSGEGYTSEYWLWEMPAAKYSLTLPKGHGLTKLSLGDEKAIEDFLQAFPLDVYPKAKFDSVAAAATEDFVEYQFIMGYIKEPRFSAMLNNGGVIVLLEKGLMLD